MSEFSGPRAPELPDLDLAPKEEDEDVGVIATDAGPNEVTVWERSRFVWLGVRLKLAGGSRLGRGIFSVSRDLPDEASQKLELLGANAAL